MNRRGFLATMLAAATAPAIRADHAIFGPAKLSPPYPTPDRAVYPPGIKPKRHS